MRISIIIPTLNECDYVRKTIERAINVASRPADLEFIVVDAGSSDGTLQTIEDLPCQRFSKPEFQLKKHKSLNFGIRKATSDILLFLDADTQLPKHFDQHIAKAMANQQVVGGAFEMRFIQADARLTVLAKLNAIRYRIWQTFYGDQAIFSRRHEAIMIGGFPGTLMEAAYFCRSIKRYGKLTLIQQNVQTSARRFHEHGFWKVLWFDFRMWLRFIFNADLKMVKNEYWNTNLQNG